MGPYTSFLGSGERSYANGGGDLYTDRKYNVFRPDNINWIFFAEILPNYVSINFFIGLAVISTSIHAIVERRSGFVLPQVLQKDFAVYT